MKDITVREILLEKLGTVDVPIEKRMEIVKEWLRENNYDGLYKMDTDDTGCECQNNHCDMAGCLNEGCMARKDAEDNPLAGHRWIERTVTVVGSFKCKYCGDVKYKEIKHWCIQKVLVEGVHYPFRGANIDGMEKELEEMVVTHKCSNGEIEEMEYIGHNAGVKFGDVIKEEIPDGGKE